MRSGAFVVVVVMIGIASTARASDPQALELGGDGFATTVGEHTTQYAIDRAHAGRAHNVELAASRLDGAVLAPGEELSFNDRVGERTRRAGFREAPEIADGHVTSGYGGGVCQVASTLHVAALRADLDVLEHRTHSFVSTYASPGLDATVSFGRIDYRVRNPHAFPVRVRASAAGGALRVWIEGAHEVRSSDVQVMIARRIRRGEQVSEDARLAPGARVVDERGRDGAVAIVTVTRPDGTTREERMRYDAMPRVVRVGPR
ncbi:VanW family protein [Sandaracinus amylolyticus]|uniref:VanW family protein n=1 Tax=Sandaracinus amylolyticus TaxID=927083 RepID=UPI001F19AB3E|nr:VanW family protein [Sandaracinus amylolyticus]UJR84481.1 Hypothetical protein I5071_65600 [Sandaracinus amylolyticus]